MYRFMALAIAFLTANGLQAQSPEGFFFRPGDRICFLGDSITEQYQYSSAIELYLTTRFPEWKLSFVNAGIGGDTATGGARRFASHVLAEKPTCVTIDFGMNDGGYGGLDKQKVENYAKNTEAMLEAAKKAGVRVALISPNAVEVRNQKGLKTYLETQKEFYAPLAGIAAKFSVPFVDQYAVTRKILEKLEADNASVKPFPDGVHTNNAGGILMAHSILTGLKAPALVSDAQIDVAGKSAKTERSKVTIIEAGPQKVVFERLDEALPLPVGKEWKDMGAYLNDLKDLNYYGLKVTGLADGKYDLSIDGETVGSFTKADLANGVNLGNISTGPIHAQSQKVFNAINDKNRMGHDRFRQVVMFSPQQLPGWLGDKSWFDDVAVRREAELAKRAEVIAQKQAELHSMAKPVSHRFELKPSN